MRQKVFIIGSDPKHLKPLRETIAALLPATGLPEKTQEAMLVALGEACTNSMRHAYGGKSTKKIRVTFQNLKDKVVLKIRDYGRKIDLAKVKAPQLPPQSPGGLGIYFMKTMMDELKYNTRHLRGNELILIKHKQAHHTVKD